MSAFVVTLQGGAPWGLRLQGGTGTGEPLRIAKINPGSKAARAQLHVGDIVETVNGVRTGDIPVNQAQKLLHNNSNDLQLRIYRSQVSVNGSYHPNGKMSAQSSLIVTNDSGFSGTDDRSLVRKPSQEDVIHLDGVTLQGFDPGSVSVTRTTTTKVTKTTRSRSPSPVRVRRFSSEGSPRLARAGSTPARIRMRVVPSGHDSESESGEVIMPTFATGVSYSSPTKKGSPTSPPMSPTNGFPMSPSQQKGVKPPPVMDIPNNNNNLRKDEDEFWPPPPPPDESIWSPSKGSPSVDRVPAQMAPPPPPARDEDSRIAPVWTPGGAPPVKKEFKPVKPDLTNRPKTSTVKPPTYSSPSPAAHSWSPSTQGVTSPKPDAPITQPMAVDTLPDPSHILSPSYVSPRSSITQPPSEPQPPPPPQFAGDAPSSPHPPALSPGGRPVPHSPAGAVPYQPGGPVQFDGMSNGYGFLPASAVMSGSPGAVQSDLLMWGAQPGTAPPPSTNDNSAIILDPSNLPPGALFQKQTVEGDVVHTDTFYPVQNVTRKTSTTVKHEAPNYEGIGPRDKEGLPLGLRQHVKEDNRHDWYKEMFKSIHKQDKEEDYSDEYSPPQNLEDDSSDSVFMSENENMHVQDGWKASENRDSEPERVVKNTPTYRVQPGRITDFVPGKSALAAHEKTVQSKKDGPLYYEGGRRGSAPGSGYASDDEARKAYHSFVKSGELPSTSGFGFGAPPARRETKTSTAGPIQPSLQPPSHQPPPSSSISSSLSPAVHGAPSPSWSGSASGAVPTTTLTRSASLPRTTGLPKRRQRYSEGSGMSAAQRLGIKTPPPARLSASATTKPVVQDSRYDYMDQISTAERQNGEKKPRQVREPDASYNKSLPEYLPIKSPSISDDRFDDFDFSPPITVPAAKQELTRASAIALYPFTAQTKKELSFKKGDTIYLTRDIDKNWLEGEHHGNKGIFPRTYVEIVTSIEEARNLQVNAPSSEGKGRAKYRFKGETTNELSVNKGEIVDLVRRIDANWWEVRHGNKAGIVPVAYLDVLREPQQGMSSPQPKSPMPKSPLSPGAGRGPLSPNQAPRSPSHQAPRSPSHQAPRSPSNQLDNPYQTTSPYQSDIPSAGRQQPSQQQHRVGQGPRGAGGCGVQQAGRGGGRPSQNAGYHQKRPDGDRYRAVYSYQPSNDDELEIMEGETVVVMEKCDDGWYVGFSESTGQFGTFPGNYVERL